MTNAFSKPGIAGARILIIEGEQSWDNGILSAFPILEEMMQRAGYSRISESKLVDQENASKALPCECFDYIIGSGEGGWLALMLGRLGMSVSQAQKAYITIRHKVSNASQDQRAATLEECLMDMVETMTISSNQDEKLQASTNRSACDTAVLAMTSAHLAAPTVFRTYSVRKNATQNCSIWSAIRACTADPKVFPPAQIGGQNYISASVADNSNPIDVALEEVKMLWPDMKLGAVVSIGSGHRGPISAESPDFTEHLAKDPGQSWQRTVRAGNLPYYRFNVDQGLQWLSSSKANYINTIFAHSSSYLQNPDIDEKLDELVSLLSAQESQIPQFESPEGSSTSNLGLKVISSPLTSTISRGPRMRIHHSVSTTPPVRTYMNELYKAGHGLPLWDPQPLFKCKPVEIGDVGLITEDGGFEILFNATVPAEQQKYRLPPNFIPLDINNADIQICTEVTSAPYIVCGDIKLHAQGFPGGADDRNSGEFELTFDAMRGAVLVLSDPPVRLSVRPSHRIRSYIEKNAETWYHFLERDSDGPELILNGQSLVFVTGVCRNSKWAAGAWDNNHLRSEVSYLGSATISNGNRLSLSGNWDSPRHNTKQGPSSARGDALSRLRTQDSSDLPEHLAGPSQCLFIRGYTIAARNAQEVDPHNVFPQPSWLQNAWKSLRLGIPPILRAAAEPHDPPPPPPPPSPPAVLSRSASQGPDPIIQDIPIQRPPQHPIRGLTDLIFDLLPAARFAVVHDDNVYGTMLETNQFQMTLGDNNVVSLSFPDEACTEGRSAAQGGLASNMPQSQLLRYDFDTSERRQVTEVVQEAHHPANRTPAFRSCSVSREPAMQFSTQLSQFSRINDSPDDLHASDVHSRSPYLSSSHLDSTSPRPSSIASTLDDILLPGDYVAEGGLLQGEPIRRVSLGSSPPASLEGDCTNQPHSTFQVVRRLGTGSYAVVYLVREVFLAPSSSSSGEGSIFGSMDVGGPPVPSRPHSVVYGHEYAIKCLSKADLDEDQLNAQMSEVKIHQSLHSHPNIVTLHRTLETASFLLLLMEYVPGEDLFYFLEQARDHFDIPPQPDDASMASNTPPTPCLLSTLHPSQLLSRTRLRLVASMFAQMCEAVAAAHAQGVYHRDIKPENFIVTDGFVERPDRSRERKVFVKLTDFGLGTTDRDSGDMDCGSAPYISYECRNNVAPSYRTDAADVWSLGIVLINMLYHHNPWTDTSQGVCGSFSLYRSDPVKFFMTRFAGMNRVVAEFLTTKIFCILEDGKGPTGTYRVSAHEFGLWVHGLPDLFAPGPAEAVNKRHQRILSTASIDHPVSSWSQVSHRPDSRNPSINAAVRCTPTIRSRSVSRAPSAVDLYDRQDLSELSISLDQTIEESFSQKHLPLPEDVLDHTILETVSPDDSPSPSRSASVNHSRKRSRKGKGTFTTVRPTPTTLDLLAEASQSLARELSSKSRPPSVLSGTSSRHRLRKASNEPVSLLPAPMVVPSSNPMEPPPLLALATSLSRPKPVTQSPSPALPAIATKKPPKWKLSIGRTSGAPASRSPAGSSHSQTLGRFGPTHPNTPDTPLPSFTNATFSGPDHSSEDWTPFESNRSRSPQSTRGGKSPSIASSSASANWSSSRSTTSSAFTSYSNGSLRSVSTAATSVSGQSWRNKDNASINSSNSGNSSHYHPSHPNIPRNIRIMTGVPEELITLPHDPYGPSRGRRPRTKKPKDNPLGTINEPAGLSSPDGQRSPNIFDEEGGSPPGDGKPKNRQINTLARLLSGLHRNRN